MIGILDFFDFSPKKTINVTFENGGNVDNKDFTPVYLMTLPEYLSSGVPELIKEYEKFVKKNIKWLVKTGFSGVKYLTLEENIELGLDSPVIISRNDKYQNEKYSVEEIVRYYYSYKKEGDFNYNYTQEPTPKEIIEKNKEYYRLLSKYFTEKEIYSQIEKDEIKSNKRTVKRALDDGTYFNLLKNGEIEYTRLKEIFDSVGIKIPAKLLSADKNLEIKENAKKILNKLTTQSYDKLMALVEEIKKDLKPLEKEVYEREYERYVEIITSYVGSVHTMQHIQLAMPIYYKVWNYTEEKIYDPKYKEAHPVYKERYLIRTDVTIIGLKDNWEDALKKYLDDYIESLRYKIIFSIIENFSQITLPIKSIERLYLTVGYKGFEGSYKFAFEDNSSFVFNTQGIGAGGYNIQIYHYRYLTNFTNIKLPNGSIVNNLNHFKV